MARPGGRFQNSTFGHKSSADPAPCVLQNSLVSVTTDENYGGYSRRLRGLLAFWAHFFREIRNCGFIQALRKSSFRKAATNIRSFHISIPPVSVSRISVASGNCCTEPSWSFTKQRGSSFGFTRMVLTRLRLGGGSVKLLLPDYVSATETNRPTAFGFACQPQVETTGFSSA